MCRLTAETVFTRGVLVVLVALLAAALFQTVQLEALARKTGVLREQTEQLILEREDLLSLPVE